MHLLKLANLKNFDNFVNFDDVILFTAIPVDVVLQIIRKKLHNDHTLAEQPILKVKAIIELLAFCFRIAYFQVDDKFFQQKTGMSTGSCLSSIVSNMFMGK
jgi:hypothetical protein